MSGHHHHPSSSSSESASLWGIPPPFGSQMMGAGGGGGRHRTPGHDYGGGDRTLTSAMKKERNGGGAKTPDRRVRYDPASSRGGGGGGGGLGAQLAGFAGAGSETAALVTSMQVQQQQQRWHDAHRHHPPPPRLSASRAAEMFGPAVSPVKASRGGGGGCQSGLLPPKEGPWMPATKHRHGLTGCAPNGLRLFEPAPSLLLSKSKKAHRDAAMRKQLVRLKHEIRVFEEENLSLGGGFGGGFGGGGRSLLLVEAVRGKMVAEMREMEQVTSQRCASRWAPGLGRRFNGPNGGGGAMADAGARSLRRGGGGQDGYGQGPL